MVSQYPEAPPVRHLALPSGALLGPPLCPRPDLTCLGPGRLRSCPHLVLPVFPGDLSGHVLAYLSLSPVFVIVGFVTLIIFKRELHTVSPAAPRPHPGEEGPPHPGEEGPPHPIPGA